MVNSSCNTAHGFGALTALVATYMAIVVGTLMTLVLLSVTAPRLATSEAWGHEVIVVVFAVVLPLRLRAARLGRAGALRAVGIIAAVLAMVNLVEALLPGAFPAWMRVEMLVIAGVMAGVMTVVVHRHGNARVLKQSAAR